MTTVRMSWPTWSRRTTARKIKHEPSSPHVTGCFGDGHRTRVGIASMGGGPDSCGRSDGDEAGQGEHVDSSAYTIWPTGSARSLVEQQRNPVGTTESVGRETVSD